MSTGEGKSIVIAMLAIFMVKLHGMRVHVLENNEGLLERDYAVNKPFYQKFDIHSAKDLTDEDVSTRDMAEIQPRYSRDIAKILARPPPRLRPSCRFPINVYILQSGDDRVHAQVN